MDRGLGALDRIVLQSVLDEGPTGAVITDDECHIGELSKGLRNPFDTPFPESRMIGDGPYPDPKATDRVAVRTSDEEQR